MREAKVASCLLIFCAGTWQEGICCLNTRNSKLKYLCRNIETLIIKRIKKHQKAHNIDISIVPENRIDKLTSKHG